MNVLVEFFYVFLEVMQTVIFAVTIGVILACAYFAVASLSVGYQMESDSKARKYLLFSGIGLIGLIALDAWFYNALGAPLFLREFMERTQPDWNQSLATMSNLTIVLSTPADDFARGFLLPVLQYTFLFVIMGLILALFIQIFLRQTNLESEGKMNKAIFVTIVCLVAMMWIWSWVYQTFGADLILWGFFSNG